LLIKTIVPIKDKWKRLKLIKALSWQLKLRGIKFRNCITHNAKIDFICS